MEHGERFWIGQRNKTIDVMPNGRSSFRGFFLFGGGFVAVYSVIPLDNSPNQQLTVTIPINNQNITLNLAISWNAQAQYWVMTIKDRNNNIILDGVPLLCGQPPAQDLLGQYAYLNLGSVFIVNTGNAVLDSPNDQTLGSDFIMIWGDSL
jgi:hypothetical protein